MFSEIQRDPQFFQASWQTHRQQGLQCNSVSHDILWLSTCPSTKLLPLICIRLAGCILCCKQCWRVYLLSALIFVMHGAEPTRKKNCKMLLAVLWHWMFCVGVPVFKGPGFLWCDANQKGAGCVARAGVADGQDLFDFFLQASFRGGLKHRPLSEEAWNIYNSCLF